LALVFAAALGAELVAPASYETQFREDAAAPPSGRFPLGTDELGRDRLSRLLYGSRVSLLLAPAAALLSCAVAALVGGMAGYVGGWWERLVLSGIDLFLSLPWLFLLLTARAALPLNVSPWASVFVTFGLLGSLGWAAPARTICAATRDLRNSDVALHARAYGIGSIRFVLVQLLPNLRPLLLAQFWVAVPLYILSEANLGLLGLGVAEPLPSWGNLLAELENYPAVMDNPAMLAPACLLVLVMACLQLVLAKEVTAS
jgi:peptide/nickel transport system permease protein